MHGTFPLYFNSSYTDYTHVKIYIHFSIWHFSLCTVNKSYRVTSVIVPLYFIGNTAIKQQVLNLKWKVCTDIALWPQKRVFDEDMIERNRKKELWWGLRSQFPPFRYFLNFSASPKSMLAIVYHVHIWRVLPQLSCGDTCQIWMWCK